MTEQDVVKLIQGAEDFPRLSPIAAHIAQMTSDLSAPVQEVAEKIQSDPTLHDKMLKVVSSPMYEMTEGVEDVNKAISLLGYKKVCNLAVGISVLELFPKGVSGGFDYGRFWRDSLCAGVAAGEIATRVRGDFPVDLFTVGLIQNIGILLLIRSRPLEYGGAIGVARATDVHHVVGEREVLGVDHALVGSLIGKEWELPAILVAAIQHSHFSEVEEKIPDGSKTVIQAVNLSNLVTDVLFEHERKDARKILDTRARSFFGFGPKVVDEILSGVPAHAAAIGEAFSIEVDAKTEAAAAPAEEELLNKCPACEAEEQSGKFCGECGASLVVEKAEPKRHPKKVLIAEDSIASRRALSFVIKKLGFIPVEATNGAEAVELAKKDPPGMAMLDVMMPRMNGLEALKKIRGDPTTSHIPVVMLTSLTDSETVVEAVQAGANDYVVKPYTADIISQRLKKYMPKEEKKKK
ncbi:MAG: HDOD domain-containing protein [Candidatus Latescibacteria bacterium]|jgi:HD-like signal output (HDOD) protein/CheY-like chemotaxis protein|nr:HDOD domain-containing protein [Candidatus Latescibacterota bacterium]